MSDSEKNFQKEMDYICEKTKEDYGKTPARFLQMIRSDGAVRAVRKLISEEGNMSDLTADICMDKRWDLLVEYYVIKPEYKDLFTPRERVICETRLKELGWDGFEPSA